MIKINTYSHTFKSFFVFLNLYFISFFMNAYSDLDKLNLPDGFEISIFAKDLDSPRQITQTNDGYVIVGSKKGDKIYALDDQDLDGYAEKRILVAEGLQNPTGVSVFEGDLYFAEIDTIWIIKDIDQWLNKTLSFCQIKQFI